LDMKVGQSLTQVRDFLNDRAINVLKQNI